MRWNTWELKLNSTILTPSKSKLMLILSILIVNWWIWIKKLHLWYFVTFGVAYSRELSSRRDGCTLRPLTTHAIFLFCLIHQFFSHTFRVSTSFHFASSWKISTRKLSSKITMSCSILTSSSWRHLGRHFRHHVSLNLFVDFVPFSE